MGKHKIYDMPVSKVYPHYITKVEKKGKTKKQLDILIHWLTGYDEQDFKEVLDNDVSFRDFFDNAPRMNPNRKLITGVICGIRVENIEEPLMQEIRYLDKIVDELSRGKKFENILRKPKEE